MRFCRFSPLKEAVYDDSGDRTFLPAVIVTVDHAIKNDAEYWLSVTFHGRWFSCSSAVVMRYYSSI
jgi:hypothetical protein